jgi:hypothetical protein
MTTAAAPRVRGRDGAVLAERRLQRRNLVGRRFRRLLVVVDDDVALPAAHRHRRGLPRERAVLVGGKRARKRRSRERVLRLAREFELRRAVFRERSHQPALVVRVLEAIQEHVVGHRLVAHPVARARAEPHILLTVVHPVARGKPALIDACRAGAWPCPAGSTHPKIVLSTSAGLMPARSTAALIATAPRSLAASGAKSPETR